MPYPQNVETARAVEEIIRENGAVPATIALIDGKIKIGLTDEKGKDFEVTLTRRVVSQEAKVIAEKLASNIGYISVSSFRARVP